MKKQTTLNHEIIFHGIGVHSGKQVQMTLAPAACGTGIVISNAQFPGADMHIGTIVPENAMHATVLKGNGWFVSTVEHLLAALSALGVDNVRVVLDGGEVPIIDGSALPFVQGIMQAGMCELEGKQAFLTPKEPLRFADEQGRVLEVLPASFETLTRFVPQDERLRLSVRGEEAGITSVMTDVSNHEQRDTRLHVDYRAEFVRGVEGAEHFSCIVTPEFFTHEIAPARTFGFVEQLPFLRQHGLALGTSLGNTVVIGPDGLFNDMRLPDECVRHKVLDLIGDLALLGKPLAATVRAYKTGHNFNRRVVEHFITHRELWEKV